MAQEERWRTLGRKILESARGELTVNLPYMGGILGMLALGEGYDTPSLATDGQVLHYSGPWLAHRYRRGSSLVCRAWLHVIFHCLLRHPAKSRGRERALWDVSCDMAVEALLDSLDYPCLKGGGSAPFRNSQYRRLGEGKKTLTAEAIYRTLGRRHLSPEELAALEREFAVDDHSLWSPQGDQERWDRGARQVQTAMETVMSQTIQGGEAILEQLKVEGRGSHNYRAFLERFAVTGEELELDSDAFDYGYYAYGLRHYGNMPLIEPLETREVRRVRDLVIAIDTSLSTSGEVVRDFLSYTFDILRESESFFRRFRLRLLQCDDQLRADQVIRTREELEEHMAHFQLSGQGGTDFRPVFRRVEELRQAGELPDLRGLLYFTDGLGFYPEKRPDYDAAFVMLARQGFPDRVPPWGIRVLLDEDEIQGDTP